MWTKEQIEGLRVAMASASSAALDQERFDDYRLYKRAIKLIDTPGLAEDTSMLARMVEGVLGAELFAAVKPAIEADEEPVSEAALPVEPMREAVSPESPVMESVSEAEQAGKALPEEPAGESEIIAPIGIAGPPLEKLQDLRALKREQVDAAGLDDWVRRLRRAANELHRYGDSPEADEALQIAQEAGELGKLADQVAVKQAKLITYEAQKDLQGIYETSTHADGYMRQLEGTRLASLGYVIAEVRRAAKQLKEDAEGAKQRVADSMNIFITARVAGEHEATLNELYRLENQGVKYVPGEAGEQTISIFEEIRRIRGNYVKATTSKITEYLNKARARIVAADDDKLPDADRDAALIDAETECLKAVRLLSTDMIAQDLKKEQAVADEVERLAKKIAELMTRRQAAIHFLAGAMQMDPQQALEESGRLSYQRLESLPVVQRDLREKLRDKMRRPLKQALEQAASLRQKRRYSGELGAALEVLMAAQAQLDAVPEALVDLSGLRAEVKGAIQMTRDEERQWSAFSAYREQVRRSVREGAADAGILEEVNKRGRAYWQAHFPDEFSALQGNVDRQSVELSILRRAKNLYAKDPSDPLIAGLLEPDEKGKKPIGAQHKGLYSEAEELLKLHYAQAHLRDARDALQTMEGEMGLIAAPAAWVARITVYVERCQEMLSGVKSPEAPALKERASQALRRAQRMNSIWTQAAEERRRGRHAAAVQLLNQECESTGEDVELSNGLRQLLAYVRGTWRAERIRYVQERVDAPGAAPSLTELETAAGYLIELQAAHALDQDGDDLLATRVLAGWHSREVANLLGAPLERVEEGDLAEIGGRRNVDWKHLLTHLDGLLANRYGYDGKAQRTADQLRIVALGNYGLQSQREESISRLGEELTRLAAASEAAGVYAALVLRYLENPASHGEARQVVDRLRGASTKSEQVAAGLDKLLEAHQLYSRGELNTAVATLGAGVEILKALLPELAASIDGEVRQTTNKWYLTLGDKILAQALKELDLLKGRDACSLERYFALLARLNEAVRYVPADARIGQGEAILRRFNKRVATQLLEQLQGLLSSDQEALENKVVKGKNLQGWLSTAFDEHAALAAKGDEWSELDALREDFAARVEGWMTAWEKVKELRVSVKGLFLPAASGETWAWNNDPNRTPVEVIRLAQSEIGKIGELVGYEAPEVQRLRVFLSDFQTALNAIVIEFEALARLIREDRTEKYLQALQKINVEKGMRFTQQTWTLRLGQTATSAFGEALAIQLDSHYRIESLFSELERGAGNDWVESGQVDLAVGLDQIEQYVKELLESSAAWEEWRNAVIISLQELHKSQREARNYLGKGHRLGEAVNLCHQEIDELLIEKEERGLLPRQVQELISLADRAWQVVQPPRCQQALRNARPEPESRPPERNADKALLQAFDMLLTAPRIRIQGAWKRYLYLEAAAALLDLGLVRDDFSDPKVLPEDWLTILDVDPDDLPALKKTKKDKTQSLFDALQALERPRQETLQALIDKNLAALRELVEKIVKHNERFKRDRDISPQSQKTLKELLDQAARIDDQAPLVEGGFEVYKRNEDILKKRASR